MLTIVSEVNAGHGRYVICRCDCGNETTVQLRSVVSGNTKSCGCLRAVSITSVNYAHGLASSGKKHPLYLAWRGIKTRCYNPRCRAFKNYGGKGVSIADIWKDDPQAFVTWCLENGWKPGLTIDRFPNDRGNYEPNNIRFVTKGENTNFRHQCYRRDRLNLVVIANLSLPT